MHTRVVFAPDQLVPAPTRDLGSGHRVPARRSLLDEERARTCQTLFAPRPGGGRSGPHDETTLNLDGNGQDRLRAC